ncbi:glycosyltransferase family 8 protein [Aulographum hederae CBS 113979]|uniref:glycogenin glucosyltransferase n=1 Tax=Aulographum hederae CBS 113979 TaxID=1176131 RepID=A0A6G1GSQ0_9PEZI|nr:glycosyltransferase family 8 protein [Aulographum hederae CBS 113979]
MAADEVYCTLVMTDSYLPGAAILAHSLRDAGTKKKLAVLVTTDILSVDTLTELKELYDYVIPVDRLGNPKPANLYLMSRADLLFAFTKLNLWRQTQFSKIVYIDADVVALRAPDELFDIKADFAAAPDTGWPDCFNSGLMVLTPNMGEFWALQTLAASGDSFDGADQGLLNQYYQHKDWHRLSFTYNCTPSAEYQWEPAYKYYKQNISMVHFIGKEKPWFKGRPGENGQGTYGELVGRWWATYDRHYKQAKPYVLGQSYQAHASMVQQLTFGETTSAGYNYAPKDSVFKPSQPPAPEADITTTEMPFTEPGEEAENIDQGLIIPAPTVEQRRFSLPHAEWDATRSAPPAESKPEAANLSVTNYEFSDNKQLFHAPSYPEPPKDMWYEVPETKPKPYEPPAPIFPWERERIFTQPTRVFAEDLPQPPHSPQVSTPTLARTSETGETEPLPATSEDAPPFSPTHNAWDSIQGIDRYVRAVMQTNDKRSGKTGPGKIPLPGPLEELMSPLGNSSQSSQQRRESLILTDFPTAIERPSLPVTPAPIRRPNFWGGERDEQGELPQAEGVPDQAEWNPSERLDQLRRSSLLEIEHLRALQEEGAKENPKRVLVESLSGSTESAASGVDSDGTSTEHGNNGEAKGSAAAEEAQLIGQKSDGGVPVFSEPEFGSGTGLFSAETVAEMENDGGGAVSPTER